MLAFVAVISLAAWLYLFFAHHGFWHADQRLPRDTRLMSAWPSVVAIVPARNEAASISACIRSLAAQRYEGSFRVILVDDGSTDGTAGLARDAAPPERLSVISAPPLAEGWTGKLWAMQTGLTRAASDGLSPIYFWFTDADIVHPPETLSRLVGRSIHHHRDLVSLMVKLHCRHAWERLLIPAFVYFFQMLYPFRAANDDKSHIAAAAGGCILIKREALLAAGGLEPIRGEIIDDCALARIVKRSGGRLWLGLSDGSASLREAMGLAPLWAMVRRTAFTQLKYSVPLLTGTLLGLVLIFLVPASLIATWPWHGDSGAALVGLLASLLMTLSYIPTVKDYGLAPWRAILLPVAAALYAAMTFASAIAHWRRQGGAWKGRTYSEAARQNDRP
ncbi:MAG: glycosyltransferase [Proteobacteria bacterium]|nr:glycosyltransferase [Pseudomonadota bacterium]